MKDNYFLGIYWEARNDSVELCVNMLYETFVFLDECDDSFHFWYTTQRPKKGQVIEPINLSKEGIKDLLIKGQNFNDDGTLNSDLGYLVYLKSSKDFSKAHVISITCGNVSKLLKNSVTLNMYNSKDHPNLNNNKFLEKIYLRLVEIWRPANGIIRHNNNNLLAKVYN